MSVDRISITAKKTFSAIISSSIFVAGLTTALAANATTINFDNLSQPTCEAGEETGGWCDPLYVTNQYAAQGVLFSGAALAVAADAAPVTSPPAFLTDFYGPGLDIFFTEPLLPTSVSMYVSAFNQDAVFIDAFGADGTLVSSFATDGWRGTDETSTEYRDKQLVSFSGFEISHLYLIELYSRRGSTSIDDLSFNRDSTSVPEPSMPVLIASGLGLIALARHRKLRRKKYSI